MSYEALDGKTTHEFCFIDDFRKIVVNMSISRVCSKSNTTVATGGARSAYISGIPKLIPSF
jgi:hypothetical protein